MAKLIVRHKVANYDAWKVAFDSMLPVRKQYGWTGHEVLRDVADPLMVTIINSVGTADQARAYGASPELKEAMQSAGVVGKPEVYLVEESEARPY